MPWFSEMMAFEKENGERYGIDYKGGGIELWRLANNQRVVILHPDEVRAFFWGLRHYDFDMMLPEWDYMAQQVETWYKKRGACMPKFTDKATVQERRAFILGSYHFHC